MMAKTTARCYIPLLSLGSVAAKANRKFGNVRPWLPIRDVWGTTVVNDGSDDGRCNSVQVLTAPGAGAVAVIQVTLGCETDVSSAFQRFSPQPPRDLSHLPVSRIIFGSWDGEDVVVVQAAPGCWEIHCHGGFVAVNRILGHLRAAAGVSSIKQLEPRSEKSEAIECAESVLDSIVTETLMSCRTKKTAGLALAQLDGRLHRLREKSQSADDNVREQANQHIQKWQSIADHLTAPWRIALVGAPNVGKSSLVNRIAGLQRSIVSNIPGTTRDLVEVDVPIDGWMFRFVDTAGIRTTSDSCIENLGIQQSFESINEADIICVVLDASATGQEKFSPQSNDAGINDAGINDPEILFNEILQNDSRGVPVCVLWNKCDLLNDSGIELIQLRGSMTDGFFNRSAAHFSVSAETGFGLSELAAWIVKQAVPEEPGSETVLPLRRLNITKT